MESPVKHAQDILDLLNAALLHKQLSVIHCPGHQMGEGRVSKGNRVADEAARRQLWESL
jgi:hypothetical protein